MLNKSDISQIRTVVREEVETQIKPVNNRLGNVETHLVKVEDRLGNVETHLVKVEDRLGNVETQIKTANKSLKKVEQLSKDTLAFLDKQSIDLEKRTKRIEHHLDLPLIV